MNKLFLDTNFLLDIAMSHRPGADSAAQLFDVIASGVVIGYVAPSSLKDFYCITRRDITETMQRQWIALFLDAFEVAPFTQEVCRTALKSNEPDFEDGLIRADAEQIDCSYIISRDEKAFVHSKVPRVSAEDYLAVCSLG